MSSPNWPENLYSSLSFILLCAYIHIKKPVITLTKPVYIRINDFRPYQHNCFKITSGLLTSN